MLVPGQHVLSDTRNEASPVTAPDALVPAVASSTGRYPDDSFFPRLAAATARAVLIRRAARRAA